MKQQTTHSPDSKRNFIVSLPDGKEVKLYQYKIALSLVEKMKGHLLIIIN